MRKIGSRRFGTFDGGQRGAGVRAARAWWRRGWYVREFSAAHLAFNLALLACVAWHLFVVPLRVSFAPPASEGGAPAPGNDFVAPAVGGGWWALEVLPVEILRNTFSDRAALHCTQLRPGCSFLPQCSVLP